jgi:hypothetical protein
MSLNILTPKEFEAHIKKLVIEKHPITMIEAVLLFCEERNLEIETAAGLITPKMKASIEGEAIKSRMITINRARLPIEVDD